ncbi:hypothetical protein Peetri_00067 [Pseudomonas phage vB_PpuM-Peetri]
MSSKRRGNTPVADSTGAGTPVTENEKTSPNLTQTQIPSAESGVEKIAESDVAPTGEPAREDGERREPKHEDSISSEQVGDLASVMGNGDTAEKDAPVEQDQSSDTQPEPRQEASEQGIALADRLSELETNSDTAEELRHKVSGEGGIMDQLNKLSEGSEREELTKRAQAILVNRV